MNESTDDTNRSTPRLLLCEHGSAGVGAFVGAGRRSLALSERSELASDGRATEKAHHGAFVGECPSEQRRMCTNSSYVKPTESHQLS